MPPVARFALTLSLALAATLPAAHAQDVQRGALTITHTFARATVPGQPGGGAFLTIRNAGPADRLISASTPAAKLTELHEMKLDGDVMRMRAIDAIALPAGQTVELKPGSYHVMMTGLAAPLKAGDHFPLTLRFEKAGEVAVDVQVEALGAAMGGMKASGPMGAMKP